MIIAAGLIAVLFIIGFAAAYVIPNNSDMFDGDIGHWGGCGQRGGSGDYGDCQGYNGGGCDNSNGCQRNEENCTKCSDE